MLQTTANGFSTTPNVSLKFTSTKDSIEIFSCTLSLQPLLVPNTDNCKLNYYFDENKVNVLELTAGKSYNFSPSTLRNITEVLFSKFFKMRGFRLLNQSLPLYNYNCEVDIKYIPSNGIVLLMSDS